MIYKDVWTLVLSYFDMVSDLWSKWWCLFKSTFRTILLFGLDYPIVLETMTFVLRLLPLILPYEEG